VKENALVALCGLDASVKSVSMCVVGPACSVLARGETTPNPEENAAIIAQHAPAPKHVAHKSGLRPEQLDTAANREPDLARRHVIAFFESDIRLI